MSAAPERADSPAPRVSFRWTNIKGDKLKPIARLTNSQSTMADKAGAAWQRHRRADRERIAAYLDMGAHLQAARETCEHGEFAAVLARAGIPRAIAYRAMRLSRFGLKCPTVGHLGGIRRADKALTIAANSPDPRRALALMIRAMRAADREHRVAMAMIAPMVKAGKALATLKGALADDARARALREGRDLPEGEYPAETLWRNVHGHAEGFNHSPAESDAMITIAESGLSLSALATMVEDEPYPDTPEALAKAIRKRAA